MANEETKSTPRLIPEPPKPEKIQENSMPKFVNPPPPPPPLPSPSPPKKD